MTGPLTVGEVVEFCNLRSEYLAVGICDGDECEITRTLDTYSCTNFFSGATYPVYGYQVHSALGYHIVEPEFLRRKKPPQSFTGEQRIRELFTPAPAKELEPA